MLTQTKGPWRKVLSIAHSVPAAVSTLVQSPHECEELALPTIGQCLHWATTYLPRQKVLAAVDSYAGYKATLLAIKVATSGSTVGVFLNVLFRDESS